MTSQRQQQRRFARQHFLPTLRAKLVAMVQIKETVIVKVHRHYLVRYKLGV